MSCYYCLGLIGEAQWIKKTEEEEGVNLLRSGKIKGVWRRRQNKVEVRINCNSKGRGKLKDFFSVWERALCGAAKNSATFPLPACTSISSKDQVTLVG